MEMGNTNLEKEIDPNDVFFRLLWKFAANDKKSTLASHHEVAEFM